MVNVHTLRCEKMNERRAYTEEQKRQVMERILSAWIKLPSLRLGQLLANVVTSTTRARAPTLLLHVGNDLYACEDTTLADICENFADKSIVNP